MSDLLQEAIKAVKADDKETGKRLLTQLIQSDPDNETAWLWMTQVAEDDQERIKGLQNVLRINPDNQAAKRGLAALQQEQRSQPTEDGATKDSGATKNSAEEAETSARPSVLSIDVLATEPEEPSKPRTIRTNRPESVPTRSSWYQKPSWLILWGGAFLVLCVCPLATFGVLNSWQQSVAQFQVESKQTISVLELPNFVPPTESAPTPIATSVVLPTSNPTDTPVPPFSPDVSNLWINSVQVDDIIYLLFNSPNSIQRYHMSEEIWLTPIDLRDGPLAFTADTDGIYVSFGRNISRFNLDGTDETPLFNAFSNAQNIFTTNNFMYIHQAKNVFLSINKFSGEQIDSEEFRYAYQHNTSLDPRAGKIFARNRQRIIEMTLNNDGTFGVQKVTYLDDYPPADKIFIVPYGRQIIDDAGVVYDTGDLTHLSNFRTTVQDVAFYGESPITLKDGVLIAYSHTFQETGRHALLARPLNIYVSGEFIYAFSNNLVEGLKVTKVPVGYVDPH